ncbi:MAG TPA: hypothetical protein VGJ15_07565 [Pirellulales bacterium]
MPSASAITYCLPLSFGKFSWMMLMLLAIAVVGDLVLLPALVIGPAGRLFERQYARTEPTNEKTWRDKVRHLTNSKPIVRRSAA